MSNLALRYSRNREDAVQGLNSGFLKVLLNLKKYNPEFALATFIRHIMINHLIDEFRKEQKHTGHMSMDAAGAMSGHTTRNDGELKLEGHDLFRLLQSLPEMTGKVFNLYAVDEYKHHEIATMLGIPEGTSKWHVSAARRLLKEMIVKQNEPETTPVKTTVP